MYHIYMVLFKYMKSLGTYVHYNILRQSWRTIELKYIVDSIDGIIYTANEGPLFICDKVCQWLLSGWLVSPVSSTENKINIYDLSKILLKVESMLNN